MRTGDVRASGRLDAPPGPAARPAGPDPLRTGALRPGQGPAGPAGGPPPMGPPSGGGPGGPPPVGPAGGGPPGAPRLAIDPLVTTGMIKRAELRKHLRIQQQLKVGTLALVALLLLAAYPLYLFTTAVARDPVFTALDSLDLPEWAALRVRRRGQWQPVVYRPVPLPQPYLGIGAQARGDQRRLFGRAVRRRLAHPRRASARRSGRA